MWKESSEKSNLLSMRWEEKKTETFTQRIISILINFLPLGMVAFGGPAAHLGMVHDIFVEKLQWLHDDRFLELISLGHAMPGPTSTQVITAIGIFRAGPLGGLLAFFLWIIPGFCILTLAGLKAQDLTEITPDWMVGLAPAAMALVGLAAIRLGKTTCSGNQIKTILALLSGFLVLLTQDMGTWIFPILMIAGGSVALFAASRGVNVESDDSNKTRIHPKFSESPIGISQFYGTFIIVIWLIIFAVLSFCHSKNYLGNGIISLFYIFFRMGSLIFGGGQVMLPMLLKDILESGLVSKQQFFAGFALVQSLPGPLFNFAAFLGAIVEGVPGAIVSAIGLFGPGMVLFTGFLPLWEKIRDVQQVRIFLVGVNATAIGLIIAAFALLWEKAVHNHASAAIALSTFSLVALFRVPAPIAIIIGGVLGFLLSPSVFNLAQVDYCHP